MTLEEKYEIALNTLKSCFAIRRYCIYIDDDRPDYSNDEIENALKKLEPECLKRISQRERQDAIEHCGGEDRINDDGYFL